MAQGQVSSAPLLILTGMFQFLYPQYLYWLLLLPVVALVYVGGVYASRRNLRRMGDKALLQRLMPDRSTLRQHVKVGLLFVAAALIICMIARPQYGLKQQTQTGAGIEAVVMVDVSNSMLARDVLPSRLDRAKLLVSNLIDRMKNDKVALGVFAGEAYPQLPITTDYASAKLFVDALSVNMVTLQGTNLAAAIELGCQSFTDKKDVGKAIILITDGENHEGGAEEAAKAAAKAGVNVFVLGVGTTQGAEIPTPQGPLTDGSGQVVHTALNEQMCRQVAQAGKGIYLHLDQTNSAQEELQSQLTRLKQAQSTTSYTARDEQFQAIALLVVLVLIIEVCVNETKNKRLRRFKLFSK